MGPNLAAGAYRQALNLCLPDAYDHVSFWATRARRQGDSMTQASVTPIVENARAAREGPSLVVAYVLWLLLGLVGAHRFYLGKPVSAVFQFLSFFVLIGPIWWVVDAFLLPGMVARRQALTGDGGPMPRTNAITEPPASAPSANAGGSAPPPVADVADRLKALWEMKQSGALSESEFSAQKAKLLAAQ